MRGRYALLLVACWLAVSLPSAPPRLSAQQPASRPAVPATPADALLTAYCLGCHNQRLRTGGLAFDAPGMTDVAGHRDVWEKVFQKLRMGAMPPPGMPRPDKPALDVFLTRLETELDTAASRSLNPGRTNSVHRLNRFEYRNAVQDLLGLDVEVESLLPVDDADKNGFDNMAAVLSVSPTLLDRYLGAARKLSRLALGIAPVGPATDTYKASALLDQNGVTSDLLPFGSRGGFAVRHYFPVDGEYTLTVRLKRQLYDYVVGLGSPHQIEVRVDGERVLATSVGGANTDVAPPASFVGEVFGAPAWEQYALTADAGLAVRFRARAGPRTVGVAFVSRLTVLEDGVQPPRGAGGRLEERDEMLEGNPSVDSVAIDGPHAVEGPGDTPSRRTILSCIPKSAADEPACARQILSRIARRAYRRPLTDRELTVLLQFYEDGRKDGGFDKGLQFGIERILADPNFFFRVERDPAGIPAETAYRLTDLELASRLSFFLWSSVPDDALLDAALAGRLKDPAVLEQQVRRMLASPRASAALVDNFVSQWLQLRPLRSATPNDAEFPDFDDNLRDAFRQETSLFVGSTIRDDRSVVELLSANYTFVNERLARHYQIPNVHGNRFRRVTLPDDRRGGLLGHGSILTVTSYPNRTSPVLRGKWLLENILGTPPPPPPPDVPSLPDKGEKGEAASVRERLELHRRNPVCASCHAPMDPLGFALEHYDGVGAWRTNTEAGSPVDATGTLPGGEKVDGLTGLRTLLVSRREQFVGAMTEKLLAYATGRGLEYYEPPAVRRIVRESAADDYRWSSLVLGVVRSVPFQMRRSRPEESRPVAVVIGQP